MRIWLLGVITALTLGVLPAAASATIPWSVLGSAKAGRQEQHAERHASRSGTLVVLVTGVPKGLAFPATLKGPKVDRRIESVRVVLKGAITGRYDVLLRSFKTSRDVGSVKRGASVVPLRSAVSATVKSGKTTTLKVGYGAIINPAVRKVPSGIVKVLGNPDSPSALVYAHAHGLPGVGVVLSAGPSRLLPYGLVAKVVGSSTSHGKTTLRISEVPITDAVPEFSYSGAVNLAPIPGAGNATADARRAHDDGGPCSSDGPFIHTITPTEFQIRQASLGLFPPQENLTLALRTNESLGVSAQVASLDCNWSKTLASYDAAIPTPFGIPIPVFANLNATAGVDLSSSLGSFTLNLASTHVLTVDLGKDNDVSEQEQGANVWTTGSLAPSAQATFKAGIEVEPGIGNPDAAALDVHLNVGPSLTWQSGDGCALNLVVSATGGGTILGHQYNLPSYTHTLANLWTGCGAAGGGLHGGGGNTIAPTLTVATPSAQGGTVGQPITPLQVQVDDTYGGKLEYGTEGADLPEGLLINPTTGEISGTPTTAGTSTVRLIATDYNPNNNDLVNAQATSGTFQWIITPAAGSSTQNTVSITNPGAQSSDVGQTINLPVTASDSGRAALQYSTGNSLPTGLTISPTTGIISGQPAVAGTYNVTLTVTDTTGSSSSVSFTWFVANVLTIQGPGDQNTPACDPNAASCPELRGQVTASSTASGPLNFSVSQQNPLPPGVSLGTVSQNANGATVIGFSGSPNTAGVYTVTITATDSAGTTASVTFTWNVSGWTQYSLPVPADADPNVSPTYTSVSCATTTFCVAVGEYESNADAEQSDPTPGSMMAAVWNGARWTLQNTSGLGGIITNGDGPSVSCPTDDYCMATSDSDVPTGDGVGDYTPFAAEWRGGNWQDVSPALDASRGPQIGSVSCGSPSFCIATGLWVPNLTNAMADGEEHAVAYFWDGAAWSAANASGTPAAIVDPNPPTGDPTTDEYSLIETLDCLSASFCIAAGRAGTSPPSSPSEAEGNGVGTQAFAETWNGNAWSSPSQLPSLSITFPSGTTSDTQTRGVFPVTCNTTDSCLATEADYYSYQTGTGSGGGEVTEQLSWQGQWSGGPTSGAYQSAGTVFPSACAVGGLCLGLVEDTNSGDMETSTWDAADDAWSTPADSGIPNMSGLGLGDLSCGDSAHCVGVGPTSAVVYSP